MNMNDLLQQVDKLFEENKGAEAEQIMLDGIRQAMQENDDESVLSLLNELLGYYRETSQVENSLTIAEQAISQAKRMGLEGTLPYATTLLNIANALRAAGQLQDSMQKYLQVRAIYEQVLSEDSMLAASLENNISLLYQEMGEFAKAKESLLKALPIVETKQADFEIGVTYANLATTELSLDELEDAMRHAKKALQVFGGIGVEDAHYGAALSALGTYYYKKKAYAEAASYFKKAMEIMERSLGRNEFYYRLEENYLLCEKEKEGKDFAGGLALCRDYYEQCGKKMLLEQFPKEMDQIAAGLVGEGSDCFGYDDAWSIDHDWGPDFCLWVSRETYERIGEKLQEAYEALPFKWQGYQRTKSRQGAGRRGVMTVEGFYERLLGSSEYEKIDWRQVEDASLAAAVNGEVFRDPEGTFSQMRKKLKAGYPERILYLKLAQSAARFSQSGQYNYARMLRRKDGLTAQILLHEALKEAMKLQHYIEGRYPPHDKWLKRSLQETQEGKNLTKLLQDIVESADLDREEKLERVGAYLAEEMYRGNLISDTDPYLDNHTEELLKKALLAQKSDEELVEAIAKLEFEAFDKVNNEGGRAECQNNWPTFSIMRKSQYLTWNRTMLLQYYYDFEREYHLGHNLITEKYGRMMESTAPEEYEKIKSNFPELTAEKKAIIEQIVGVQVGWMESFAAQYPMLADNARSIRSGSDNYANTSYETYLRGEISTYSDKMLELYGRYVVDYAKEGKNLAFAIMENSVHLYGYKGLKEAEEFLKK